MKIENIPIKDILNPKIKVDYNNYLDELFLKGKISILQLWMNKQKTNKL